MKWYDTSNRFRQ